jgi:hypothetical protein
MFKTPQKEECKVLSSHSFRKWEDPVRLKESIVKGVVERRWKESPKNVRFTQQL